MGQDLSETPLSLYLHIPFCLSRCGYCSFFSMPFRKADLEQYLGFLHRELKLYADILQHPLKTLYFGGGSPSLLSPEQINSITGELPLSADAEITLEINPIQITPNYLQGLRSTPINRLSIGLQSMMQPELTWLGRRHTTASIPARIDMCRHYGYQNLSLDFIYGLPLELHPESHGPLGALQANLEHYLELSPEHLSCYLLCLDEDSKLAQEPQRSMFHLPGDTLAAQSYHLIRKTLVRAGYQHYEISNFARPGYQSRHNRCYWQNDNYLACGASAAGWINPRRYQNPANLNEYYEAVSHQQRFPGEQLCNSEQITRDKIMMGLRLIDGIDVQSLAGTADSPLFSARLARLKKIGMLKQRGRKIALTNRALFVSNAVIGELLS